jgi:hypothetical protein
VSIHRRSDLPVRLFESASTTHYLIDRYDAQEHRISYAHGMVLYYEMCSWLVFMDAGVGSMQGGRWSISIGMRRRGLSLLSLDIRRDEAVI